jgi:hypothetical protein
MKILVTNWRLNTQGGTEEWAKLMAQSLRYLGHEVDLNDTEPKKQYDLAIINHLDPKLINAKKKIYTCHGIIPKLERPREGADVYVAVSEEVKDFHNCDVIIRNPIDTERFYPKKPVNQELKNILVISNNPIDMSIFSGLNVTRIGGDKRVPNPEAYINEADLVISLGRGAYEAMACNRNVLVYDYNGGDGLIDEESYYRFRENNCSGRYNGYKWTQNELTELLKGYKPHLELRDIIEKEHDPIKIAKEYLAL